MRFYKEPPPGFTSLRLSIKGGDTPGVHAPAQTITRHPLVRPQSRTPEHDTHLDLVFVVSRKLSAPAEGGPAGGGEGGSLRETRSDRVVMERRVTDKG